MELPFKNEIEGDMGNVAHICFIRLISWEDELLILSLIFNSINLFKLVDVMYFFFCKFESKSIKSRLSIILIRSVVCKTQDSLLSGYIV